jgi:para-aminobenzoate synthetase component 1
VFLSAAAGAAMIGAPTGAPSPSPEVPDLVAVIHEAVRETTSRGTEPIQNLDKGPLEVGFWTPSWTPEAHRDAVEATRAAIARGDVYQVNLVGHAAARYRGSIEPALAAVAALPGASWAGRLSSTGWSGSAGGFAPGGGPAAGGGPAPGGGPASDRSEWALACGSPECLITVENTPAGPVVVTRPIKGTGPRTDAGRVALLASAKERAEHVMIVDLARNDLGRIASTGSVRVDGLFEVRPWCDLWQAESTVSASLRPGVGLAELLRAVCPGASVTGAPKRAALETLTALEPVGRGPAMGALGYIGHDRIELGLTIRTVAAVADPAGDGGTLHLWAGGGVTWSSDPDAEVAEAAAKAAPLAAVLT